MGASTRSLYSSFHPRPTPPQNFVRHSFFCRRGRAQKSLAGNIQGTTNFCISRRNRPSPLRLTEFPFLFSFRGPFGLKVAATGGPQNFRGLFGYVWGICLGGGPAGPIQKPSGRSDSPPHVAGRSRSGLERPVPFCRPPVVQGQTAAATSRKNRLRTRDF